MVIEVDREPLVAMTVMVYVPWMLCLLVEIVRITDPVPPDERVTEPALSVAVGLWRPVDVMLLERLIVPVNPPTLVRVMVDVPWDPRTRVRLVGLAEMVKLGLGLPGIVSESGVPVPFAIVTQKPLTLVGPLHPVWKFMTVPDVVATTL
jgi:hypothetical protein